MPDKAAAHRRRGADRDVQLQVVSGNGWDQAPRRRGSGRTARFSPLGTSPRGDVARVFLGSRGTKILRVSPVRRCWFCPADPSSREEPTERALESHSHAYNSVRQMRADAWWSWRMPSPARQAGSLR